ncbi:MAG: alanine--tRNA ligase [Phycisphaerae bacterium]|jgi:alanyl-tRNA synthetase
MGQPPTPRTAAQVRQEFIDFFVRRCGHTHVPGSPVVPQDDATLLFTNAGMNQFKPLFLGTADRHSAFGRLKRAANSQVCIRAGGKHNDLDDVGHDTYHHTCFEMLGNWSFGDYFKKEAIAWAWELLTQVWGIDPQRLHATYFGGLKRTATKPPSREVTEEGRAGRKDGGADGWELEPDLEARDLWLQYLPAERVHPGSAKDNFWEMGDTGPCGPCSEIHIDLTPDKSGGPLVNAGDARVIEIWNLVFIQFNRGPDGALTPLPDKHVDTGMGFERVAAVIRGFETGRVGQVTNYDTDVFAPIFDAIAKVTGAAPYGGRLESSVGTSALLSGGFIDAGAREAVMRDVAYRVIADHIRTLTFAISDGALPDKEGRGYVLRRILRRAVRYGWQYLGMHEPFLCRLVPTVVQVVGEAFPKLRESAPRIVEVIREEEVSFARTLERGIELFEEAAAIARGEHHGRIRGEDAFKLHDTYGFPIDLTQIMAAERGMTVDIGEYERLMEAARERARGGGAGETASILDEWRPQAVTPCDETPKYGESLAIDATIRMLHSRSQSPGVGDEVVVITDRTCFYAEQGGQVCDTGLIETPTGRVRVNTTARVNGVVAHVGVISSGTIRVEQPCRLVADPRRRLIMRNHTATHLLNWALREVLDPAGQQLQQKGSLVDSDKTRFDFSHGKPLEPAELEGIESLVAERIRQDLPVETNDNVPVPLADAQKINGLRAVFGEKYPDRVRVVSIGVPVAELLKDPTRAEWRKYSIEFCGGTHVKRTAEIEAFALTHEEAVAKGIRRVVGVTGDAARRAVETGRRLIERVEALLAPQASGGTGVPTVTSNLETDVADLQRAVNEETFRVADRQRLRALLADLQQLFKKRQKQTTAAAADVMRVRVDELLASAAKHGPTTLVVAALDDASTDNLKLAADMIKQRAGSAAVLLASVEGIPPVDSAAGTQAVFQPSGDRRLGGDEGAGTGKPPTATGRVVLVAAVSDDLVKKGVKAGDWIKAVAPIVEGGGGGPPTMAQAGGKNPARLGEALAAGREWVAKKLT